MTAGSNAPPFDPLHPTPEEEADMVRGYGDGFAGREPPAMTSAAYDHGRRNGVNDRLGRSDPDQIALAQRMRAEGRFRR